MRTTVTLDPDTEALLRAEAARTGMSFKVVLNETLKRALAVRSGKVRVKPVFPAPFPSAFTGKSFNRLGDEWDDEETLGELGR